VDKFFRFLYFFGCLKDQGYYSSQAKSSYATQAQKKTFAQALNNACDIPLSHLSSLCIKKDFIFVQIDEDVYLAGLKNYKNHLHGRIVLSKGTNILSIWTCEKSWFFLENL